MKTRLIKLQNKFILVSDEKAKEGDIGYIPFERGSVKTVGKYFADDWVKVISENPDFSLLSEEDCKRIGWVDIEKLAENKYSISRGGSMWMPSADDCNKANKQEGFIEGFKTAQSLTDEKLIGNERGSLDNFLLHSVLYTQEERELIMDAISNWLQQTEWDVEVNELNQITKIL